MVCAAAVMLLDTCQLAEVCMTGCARERMDCICSQPIPTAAIKLTYDAVLVFIEVANCSHSACVQLDSVVCHS
jgi:hypothetical protein